MQSLLNTTRRADISFHRSGLIGICAPVVRALALRPGDSIDIVNDGVEYYLRVAHRASDSCGARYHARCYPANRCGHHYRANSRQLCAAILRVCSQSVCARLPVGKPIEHDGDTWLPLITRLNLPR